MCTAAIGATPPLRFYTCSEPFPRRTSREIYEAEQVGVPVFRHHRFSVAEITLNNVLPGTILCHLRSSLGLMLAR